MGGLRRLAVIVRVALVALAASAVVAAAVASRRDAPASARRYSCPMHSEVTAATPGDCPICGMALEEVGASAPAALPKAGAGSESVAFTTLRASNEATNLLKFSVAQARRNSLPGEVIAPASVGPDGEVVAQLYRDELASLTPGETAEFQPSAPPGAPDQARAALSVRRSDTPPSPPGPRDATARVEFRAERGAAAPRSGQVGWLKLAYKTRAMLVVRSAAIVPSPDGPYVLVFSAERGALTRRRIEIGKDYSGMTAVVAGLRDKEFVVMANTFAFDAERRLEVTP